MAGTWQAAVCPPGGTVTRHLGTRFDATGRFLPEHGNTVVAQVIPGSTTESALVWLRGALQALPWGQHFAYTAIPSYHMTVFEGVIESRRLAGHWPPSVPLDASIDAATEAMTAMLDALPALPDFAIRPVEVTPFGLRLTGATAADEAAARHWREALAGVFGYRTPTHDSYGFHTTLAYVKAPLPQALLPACEAAMADLTRDFLARVPVLDLARPAFCRFADMNAFPPVRAL
jgi:hypothetical protein